MPKEKAIAEAFRAAAHVANVIEVNEAKWQCMDGQCMDGLRRSELGAWRRLLFEAGIEHDKLPEVPFLNPDHKAAFDARCQAHREEREAQKRTAEAL